MSTLEENPISPFPKLMLLQHILSKITSILQVPSPSLPPLTQDFCEIEARISLKLSEFLQKKTQEAFWEENGLKLTTIAEIPTAENDSELVSKNSTQEDENFMRKTGKSNENHENNEENEKFGIKNEGKMEKFVIKNEKFERKTEGKIRKFERENEKKMRLPKTACFFNENRIVFDEKSPMNRRSKDQNSFYKPNSVKCHKKTLSFQAPEEKTPLLKVNLKEFAFQRRNLAKNTIKS